MLELPASMDDLDGEMDGANRELKREGRALAGRAGVVSLFTLVSRVFGYIRDTVLAHYFGSGVVHDAYVVAQTIPNVFRRLVAEGSLMIAFVPILVEERERGGAEAMRAFIQAVLGMLIPFLILLTLAGVFFPGPLVEAFAAGFGPERRAFAETLLKVSMPFIFFVSLTAVASGVLNAVNVFGPPAAAPILLNASIVVVALLASGNDEHRMIMVCWGVSLGGAAQLALQVPFLLRKGFLVWPKIELKHAGLRKLLRRMGPAVFGVGVYQLNIIVIRLLASYMPTGQISCYYWANRLQEFALGVFAVSVSIAVLPSLSEKAAKSDDAAMRSTFIQALCATNFITVPSMFGLGLLAFPIVGVLFRHGAFSVRDAMMTTDLLRWLAAALVPIGVIRVMVPTYYAKGDTKTPVWAATVSLVVTLVLGLWLRRDYEIVGLTIATVVAGFAQLGVLWWRLGYHMSIRTETESGSDVRGKVGGMVVLRHGALCFLLAAVAVGIPAYVASWVNWLGGDNLRLAVTLSGLMFTAALLYLLGAYWLGVSELELVLGMVRRRFSRRRSK
jgi:putative peptidoglycan lipid II flippase